jgi:exodeoxyribonuclease-3
MFIDYRKKWDADFLDYLKKLNEKKPVIWCGDLNVAHKEIDLKNPASNVSLLLYSIIVTLQKNKTAGFSDTERENFTKVLEAGFIDSFRHLYPKEEGAYTFWSYMKNARGGNIGWRLDYFVISKAILDKLGDTYRRPNVMGSE